MRFCSLFCLLQEALARSCGRFCLLQEALARSWTLWTLILIVKTLCFCVLQLRSCVVAILQPFLLAPGDSSAILWLFQPILEALATLRTRARDAPDLEYD